MKRSIFRFISAIVLISLLLTFSGAASIHAQTVSRNYKLHSSAKAEKNIIQIKFTAGSNVRLEGNVFVGDNKNEVAQVNKILEQANLVKASKLVEKKNGQDSANVADSLKNYYSVKFQKDVDVDAITDQLNDLSIVEISYAKPKPTPQPSGNYVSMQKYLKPAPVGINSEIAASYPNGGGTGVKIVDLEYSWNTAHEDLAKATNAKINIGTPLDSFNDTDHGTAVIGEMISTPNTIGVTGASPSADIKLINTNSYEHGWNIPLALYIASLTTKPGDVILIEQQSWGPGEDPFAYVPIEWMPEVYDSIKALTDAGRIVIEPAGNGNHNLDNTALFGSSFPMGKPNSGAIIVGAGDACGDPLTDRSRMFFSNYGTRVNLQGPGSCVVTTGYGDLNFESVNSYYTGYFSGTSSASPVVAAAAASLSATYLRLNGKVLKPLEVAYILALTGTPQNNSINPGKIGPQPDLAKALAVADQKAPTVPTNFVIVLTSSNLPKLNWSFSTDNVKVAKYQVYRNGVLYREVDGTLKSYTNTSVTRGATYSYKVRAVDISGKYSAFTPTLSITVP